MKKFAIWLGMGLLAIAALGADKGKSGITPEMLTDIEQSFRLEGTARFIQNALVQNDAGKLTADWQKINAVDPYFSNRLKDQKITDQKSTGRCWMFAGLNILRPTAAKNLKCEEFEFSENYLFFYDKLEKANMFLEAIARTAPRDLSDRTVEFLLRDPVPDGGQWVGLVELVRKYGVVPKDVMPETQSSGNSSQLNRALSLRLKQASLQLRREASPEKREVLRLQALKDVYKILALNLGVPPKSFTWRYEDKDKKLAQARKYTPLQFYREVVNVDLDNYFALYSIPTRPFDRLYAIELDQSVYDRPGLVFANCTIETLKELSRKSVLDGQPVWFGCDVGRDSFGEKGVMIPALYDLSSLYGMEFGLSRRELFETYSCSPNHAMVFTGLDLQEGKVRKWLVENSWGEKFGQKGYYLMQDEWFDFWVQVIVVNKKYIPQPILDLFRTQPEVLPPWDPMYQAVTMK